MIVLKEFRDRVKSFDVDDPYWFNLGLKGSLWAGWVSFVFLMIFYTVVPFIELPVVSMEMSLLVQVVVYTLIGYGLYKLAMMWFESRYDLGEEEI